MKYVKVKSDLRYAMNDEIYENKKFQSVEKVKRMKEQMQENDCK